MQEVHGFVRFRFSRSWLLHFALAVSLLAAPARAEPVMAHATTAPVVARAPTAPVAARAPTAPSGGDATRAPVAAHATSAASDGDATRAASGGDAKNMAALAARFAPVVYFDQRVPGDHGKSSKCLPQSAEPYYEAHLRGDRRRICNQDARSLDDAPAYYEVAQLSGSTFITYWFFYGYQGTCLTGFGSHDSDWERIAVRVAGGQLRDVVYWQHNGRYTRRAEHVRLEGDHPVVYSGKNSHGSYHDTGGSGGCRYFADYRNPGGRKLQWHTALHLQSLAARGEAWMTAPPSASSWSKIKPPTERRSSLEETVCRDDAGRLKIAGITVTKTNTCQRSDYRDPHMRIAALADQH